MHENSDDDNSSNKHSKDLKGNSSGANNNGMHCKIHDWLF